GYGCGQRARVGDSAGRSGVGAPRGDDARLLRARGAEASVAGQPRDADPPELSSAGRRRAQTREGELYARGVRGSLAMRAAKLPEPRSRLSTISVVSGLRRAPGPSRRAPSECQGK